MSTSVAKVVPNQSVAKQKFGFELLAILGLFAGREECVGSWARILIHFNLVCPRLKIQ